MDFKKRAIAFEDERYEIEELINKGIMRFNNINNGSVDYIDAPTSGWQDQATQYVCGEKGIRITWFYDAGRCGDRDYESDSQLIPYEYFEEDQDIEKINADVKKRKQNQEKLSQARRAKSDMNSEKRNLENEIRELKQFGTKYSINTTDKQKIAEAKLENVKRDIINQNSLIALIEKEI